MGWILTRFVCAVKHLIPALELVAGKREPMCNACGDKNSLAILK